MTQVSFNTDDPRYPGRLLERLGPTVPQQLTALGSLALLALPKTALFCSARCPGSAVLGSYDQAAKWREDRRCIISGFHSPIEKECLRIFLRGTPPIIICPARTMPKLIPADWQKPLDDGRMLILSAFNETETRITSDLARRRNELVAALADEVWFAHITPGGKNELLTRRLAQWRVPFAALETT